MSEKERDRATFVNNDVRQREMKVLVMGMGRTGTTGNTIEEEFPSSHQTEFASCSFGRCVETARIRSLRLPRSFSQGALSPLGRCHESQISGRWQTMGSSRI